MADLEKMILAKKENAFGGFVNYMENKYGGMEDEEPKKKNKKRKATNGAEAAGGKKRKLN